MLEKVWHGITFRISLLFPAAVIIMLSFDESTLTMLCLLASLLHELGHALAMLIVHDRPRRVTVGIFGVRVERDAGRHLGYRAACVVSLSGPLVNVLCAVLLWYLGCRVAAVLHAGLAFFNLLPIASLDGGEALHALLCTRFGEERASYILRIVSLAVIFPLFVAGFRLLLSGGYNFTLLAMSLYLILLLFLKEKH